MLHPSILRFFGFFYRIVGFGFGLLLVACGDTSTPSDVVTIVPTQSDTAIVSLPPATPILATITSKLTRIVPTTASTKAVTQPLVSSPTAVVTKPFFAPVTGNTLLQWAQMMVQNVQPSNTAYRHTQEIVTWAGEHGATQYVSRADCSGFLNALLAQTYGLSGDTLARWLGTKRPHAETYYQAITAQTGFRIERSLGDLRPGDIIAVKYINTDPGDDTGHIMIVVGLPQKHPASEPVVAGTVQWLVPIIDSATSGHGTADTRHNADGSFREGVGQGALRLYTDPSGGLIGYSWSASTHSDYYDSSARPLVVGRIDPAFRLAP